MRKIVSISVVIVILAMFLLIGTTQGTDQETLIKRIKENYQELTSFQADIYIEETKEGKEKQGQGNIWAQEGKFRMEIETIVSDIVSDTGQEGTIEKETIVFDGKIFWIYSQPKNELITIDLSKLTDLPGLARGQIRDIVTQLEEGALDFFSPRFPPVEEIEISENKWKGRNFYVLKDGQRETWVSKEDYLIYRVIRYDETDNVLFDVELTAISLNEKISDGRFTFQVPQGVQPLDMVELMKAMFEAFEEQKSD